MAPRRASLYGRKVSQPLTAGALAAAPTFVMPFVSFTVTIGKDHQTGGFDASIVAVIQFGTPTAMLRWLRRSGLTGLTGHGAAGPRFLYEGGSFL